MRLASRLMLWPLDPSFGSRWCSNEYRPGGRHAPDNELLPQIDR